jgi:hypothetical protein
MPRQLRWLVIAAAVIVVAALIVLFRGCRWQSVRPAADFSAQDVLLDSPDLDVALVSVDGTAKTGYTDWACLLECRERRGCRAGVRIRIEYLSDGQPELLFLSGVLNGEKGEVMRLGRPQRPATAVDEVVKVTLEVVSAYRPDAPRPTPIV